VNWQQRRLLVVDDERIIADSTALIFAQAGYEARAVYSAEQALDLVREWQPSAAILDVVLPQMDGIELARLMRITCPDCRVILFVSQNITGHHLASTLTEFAILPKPIHPIELVTFINTALQAELDDPLRSA
jgi:DNA-binding response OmpR family regulator